MLLQAVKDAPEFGMTSFSLFSSFSLCYSIIVKIKNEMKFEVNKYTQLGSSLPNTLLS